MKGFIQFVREQGVVGLAVGFVLGGAVTKVVSSLVTDVLTPILGLFLGVTKGLDNAFFSIGSAQVMWGHFLNVLIDFTIVAGVVYFVVHGLGLDKIDRKKDTK